MLTSITLSKTMQKFVAEQAAERGLKNEKAYFEQLRVRRQRLLETLDEGRASGYHEVTEDTWRELREEVKKRFATRRKTKAMINR